jgi:branched-chain amino acid transport system substrate-binding protein
MHPAGADFQVHRDIFKHVYDAGGGAAKREEVGEVLYNRGMIDAMLKVEAVRTAMGKYGDRPLSGEEVRWGYENIDLSAERLKELGFEGLMNPIKVTCLDHEGSRKARVHQWDGQKWVFASDWIEANTAYLRPKVEEAAAKYAKEKNITPATCG